MICNEQCFSCPYSDCICSDSERNQINFNWADKEAVRIYKRDKQREYRLKMLEREYPFLNFEAAT